MTLRRTLVLLQIGLVAVGLFVFAFTSYHLYRQSEEQRLQTQLSQTDLPALEGALLCQEQAQSSCPQGGADRPDGASASVAPTTGAEVSTLSAYTSSAAVSTCRAGTDRIPDYHNLTAGSFAELRSSSGTVLARLFIPFSTYNDVTQTCPDPDLPATISTHHYFTVKARSGPGPFLVEALAASPVPTMRPSGPQTTAATASTIIVGVPLNNLEDSLHRLLTLDLVVGGILLIALAGGSLLVIRRSLRPLERMAASSRAISAGDLSRRVTAADDRSEVGQLGAALNGMLTRIEKAFAERDATEQRLRQFLADASHELRTPLTSIRGYAELWRLESRDGGAVATNGHSQGVRGDAATGSELDAGTAMARIEEHARRMGEMIEELLLLARLDESHPTQRAPVDLVVVAAEACNDAAALDPGRPISLAADEDTVVIGDFTHLRRAATNLMTNAIRHTPVGTRIEVQVRSGGGVAQLVVRDHGPGMSEAGLVHAFDRFWQADVSRSTGGTGLGLAIVAGVAAEHGGAATVANAPDGGAILTLRLPVPVPGRPLDGVLAAPS